MARANAASTLAAADSVNKCLVRSMLLDWTRQGEAAGPERRPSILQAQQCDSPDRFVLSAVRIRPVSKRSLARLSPFRRIQKNGNNRRNKTDPDDFRIRNFRFAPQS